MSQLHIQILQEDIDKGHKLMSFDCAIARAVRRMNPEMQVSVTGTSTMLNGKRYLNSPEMANFVRAFDIDKSLVFPTEFLLDTSRQFSHAECVCA
jgi:hypothetical protein